MMMMLRIVSVLTLAGISFTMIWLKLFTAVVTFPDDPTALLVVKDHISLSNRDHSARSDIEFSAILHGNEHEIVLEAEYFLIVDFLWVVMPIFLLVGVVFTIRPDWMRRVPWGVRAAPLIALGIASLALPAFILFTTFALVEGEDGRAQVILLENRPSLDSFRGRFPATAVEPARVLYRADKDQDILPEYTMIVETLWMLVPIMLLILAPVLLDFRPPRGR